MSWYNAILQKELAKMIIMLYFFPSFGT